MKSLSSYVMEQLAASPGGLVFSQLLARIRIHRPQTTREALSASLGSLNKQDMVAIKESVHFDGRLQPIWISCEVDEFAEAIKNRQLRPEVEEEVDPPHTEPELLDLTNVPRIPAFGPDKVLDLLRTENQALSRHEICTFLGMPGSSVRDALNALNAHDMVVAKDSKWSLTLKGRIEELPPSFTQKVMHLIWYSAHTNSELRPLMERHGIPGLSARSSLALLKSQGFIMPDSTGKWTPTDKTSNPFTATVTSSSSPITSQESSMDKTKYIKSEMRHLATEKRRKHLLQVLQSFPANFNMSGSDILHEARKAGVEFNGGPIEYHHLYGDMAAFAKAGIVTWAKDNKRKPFYARGPKFPLTSDSLSPNQIKAENISIPPRYSSQVPVATTPSEKPSLQDQAKTQWTSASWPHFSFPPQTSTAVTLPTVPTPTSTAQALGTFIRHSSPGVLLAKSTRWFTISVSRPARKDSI